ncbi:hypothetical protein GCK72_005206 [Caenorhabditis remanei]|uniref:RING-type domain-containing protein n=1 Tax=Caenorhabditis remanei TaxID=31234 RepID=A0A6A5HEK0_CAERE|nr:hypothetical protein GCK72_005206 [Caenorhabditis remanei]KAF1765254.1 hypothetical protein GCK72_005206 [Caenorhabditis remanei]
MNASTIPAEANLKKLVYNCIPKELIPTSWKCRERIETLFDEVNLGMFDSPRALREVLMEHLSSPNSSIRLNLNSFHIMHMCPQFHDNLKHTAYAYKSDVYLAFDLPLLTPFKGWEAQVVETILKHCWKQLGSRFHHEMIQVPDFTKIYYFLKNYCERFMDVTDTQLRNINLSTLREFFQDFWVEGLELDMKETGDLVYNMLMKFKRKYPVKNDLKYHKIIVWIGAVIRHFKIFMKKNSVDLAPFNETTEKKAIVRMFTIANNHFLMAHELLKTLKDQKMDVSGIEQEVLRMPELSTLTFREAVQKLDKEIMKNIEFVRMNNPIAKFVQTPIPSHNGGYCVLASDALHELLVDITVAKKVFQTIGEDNWTHIEMFFKAIESHFDVNKGIYFMNIEDLKSMKNQWEEVYNSHLKQFSSSAKIIRKVKKTGFSSEDLKETLKFLSLDRCFPDISDYADSIHSEISLYKTPNVLSTGDMHTAVTRCQFNCIIRKMPHLLEFIHNQMACTRLGITVCELCSGKRIADSKITEKSCSNNSDSRDSGIESSEAIASSDSGEENKPSINPSEEKVTKKKSKKTKKNQKTAPSSPDEAKEEVKESNSCSKCFNASKFTREANEKLRLCKIENKHLKKDLAMAQVEIEEIKEKTKDKDERIRMLERLLEEKHCELAQKDEVIKQYAASEEAKNVIIRRQESKIEQLQQSVEKLQEDQRSSQTIQVPTRSSEDSEKVRDVLRKLLAIKETLQKENPISSCSKVADRFITKTHNAETKQRISYEMRKFCKDAKDYTKAVENQLTMIRKDQLITADQIPPLPDFPVFSVGFRKTYKDTMKTKAPKICESLLTIPEGELADVECLICLDTIDVEDESQKCECCSRRYHNDCIRNWFKVKRNCPTCSSGLLDKEEFPSLG